MAIQFRIKIRLHSYVTFLILFIFFSETSIVTSIPTEELDAMLSIVRARGYNLFSNAITTSDVQLDLLNAADDASFTFFAPNDSSLYDLAMAKSASAYTATLRYHGLPRRLSVSDLKRLPSQVPIQTLLYSRYIAVSRHLRGSRFDSISVNGVDVLQPGLFYGRHVAVHGLGGILTLHSHNEFLYDSPLPPQIDGGNSKENRDFTVPPSDPSIGLSSVSPPNSPSTVNRVFLSSAPDRSRFHVQSPAISSISPSASPDQFPPSPAPLIGGAAVRMESGDDFSERTVEEYEPLVWTAFGLSEGNSKSNDVDVKDTRSRPNVPRRL